MGENSRHNRGNYFKFTKKYNAWVGWLNVYNNGKKV